MSDGRIFFIAFAGLISLVGLFAAGWADDYLQLFGLGLFAFGWLFIFGCINRHFAEANDTAEP